MVDADRAQAPPKSLLLGEARAWWELAAFWTCLPWLSSLPRGDGHPVLVLPGLAASDFTTSPLRTFLRSLGYAAHGWTLGRNTGYQPETESQLVRRLQELKRRHGGKVTLIGWSLGGLYARELARFVPGDVRGVITLGSPLKGNPRASNAWRLYEMMAGHSVDDVRARVGTAPPPVPMTAIFSRSDGIVAWQCSVEAPGERTESVEIESSHCGIAHNPATLFVIADRLAQPEDAWAPFRRDGLRGVFYPDPWRGTAQPA